MAGICVNRAVTLSRLQVNPALSAVYVSKRHESRNVVVKGQHSNLAAHKRGTGGRSSFSGIVATVLGATGFLGRSVVNQLGKIGSQVICPYRGEPYFSKDLRLAGDLGQILFLPYSITDEDSLRNVMKYSNVVINAIGIDRETRNHSFKEVHIEGAERIARIAKEVGVERLIHMSHLNASKDPKPCVLKNGSEFLRSKYYGEQAVKSWFPEAVIFRPADMFGRGDRFMNLYANPKRRTSNTMPLWKRGTETIKMPVFYRDVSSGIITAVLDEGTDGKTFECVGPNSYLLSELVDYFYRCMKVGSMTRIPIPPGFQTRMKIIEQLPSNYYVGMDKLETEHVSDELHGHPTLTDLVDHRLTQIEHQASYVLRHYISKAYLELAVEDRHEVATPEIYVHRMKTPTLRS